VIAPGHAQSATEPAGPPALDRHEHSPGVVAPEPRVTDPPIAYQLRDEDVLRALQLRQPSFLRCYRKAQRDDVMLDRVTLRLHVQVGPTGAVDSATTEGGPRALSDCVIAVARQLTFPPPEMVLDVALPLYFAPAP
jgi:hypothetical protein